MRILITGVAGFIGSSLAEYLLKENHTIIGIDNFDNFYSKKIKLQNLETCLSNKNFTFIEDDVCNKNLYSNKALNQIEVIVHLAAKAGVRPSIDSPEAYFQSNAIGTVELLEFARKSNIKKFILASSSSVYGKNTNSPWNENAELMPISPYAASKVAAENICKVYSHLYNLPIVTLRFFTVYGPKQRPDLAIHKFIRKIYNGEEIELFGNGNTYRDYTFIEDIIQGISSSIFSEQIKNNYSTFNLGNSEQVSLSELIQEIEKVTGKQAKINYLPEQAGDVKSTFADISYSMQVLTYSPKTKIKDGLAKFNEWYKKANNLE
jgi:UDP-glucuronate 4-epimerase